MRPCVTESDIQQALCIHPQKITLIYICSCHKQASLLFLLPDRVIGHMVSDAFSYLHTSSVYVRESITACVSLFHLSLSNIGIYPVVQVLRRCYHSSMVFMDRGHGRLIIS